MTTRTQRVAKVLAAAMDKSVRSGLEIDQEIFENLVADIRSKMAGGVTRQELVEAVHLLATLAAAGPPTERIVLADLFNRIN